MGGIPKTWYSAIKEPQIKINHLKTKDYKNKKAVRVAYPL